MTVLRAPGIQCRSPLSGHHPRPADVGRAGTRPRSRGRRGCQHLADLTGARRQCTVAAEHAQAPGTHGAAQAYASQAQARRPRNCWRRCRSMRTPSCWPSQRIDGRTFEQIGDELTDADLDKAWRAVRTLHDRDHPPHAHRRESRARRRRQGLVAQRGRRGDRGQRHRRPGRPRRVAVHPVTAHRTRPRSRRRSARDGTAAAGQALGSCSPSPCRAPPPAIRKRRDLLVHLRDLLLEMSPSESRTGRTRATAPAYYYCCSPWSPNRRPATSCSSQLAQNLATLVADASWGWALRGPGVVGADLHRRRMALERLRPGASAFPAGRSRLN